MYGTKAQAGILMGVTWGDAWTAVDTPVMLKSETLTMAYEQLRSQAVIAQAAQHELEIGRQLVVGDLVTELDYKYHELLEAALGAESSGVYTLAGTLPVFDLEIDKGEDRWRFSSCMVNQMTIAGASGDESPMLATFSLACRSAATSSSAFPSLTITGDNRVYLDHIATAEFADIADAIAVGDDKPISSLEIVVNNNLQTDGKDTDNTSGIILPVRNDFRMVTSKVGLARHSADARTFQTLGIAGTRIQSEINFTNSGNNFVVEFPQGKVSAPPNFNVGGPNVITGEALMEWYRNTANSYMSAVTDQVRMTMS